MKVALCLLAASLGAVVAQDATGAAVAPEEVVTSMQPPTEEPTEATPEATQAPAPPPVPPAQPPALRTPAQPQAPAPPPPPPPPTPPAPPSTPAKPSAQATPQKPAAAAQQPPASAKKPVAAAQQPPATAKAPAPPPPPPPPVVVVDEAALAAERAEEAARKAAEDAARETAEQARRLAADEETAAARDQHLEELAQKLNVTDPAPDPESIRNIMNAALDSGATQYEITAGRQYIQAWAVAELDKLLADPQDGHNWVYSLYHYIEDATRMGAQNTNPTMAAAWKHYEDRISAELAKALQAEDIALAYELLNHVRRHAKGQLALTHRATSTSQLHTLVINIVNSATSYKDDTGKLGQAIMVARGDGLDCNHKEAYAFMMAEEARVGIVNGITSAITAEDYDGLLTMLQEAGFRGLTDPEVAQGQQHIQSVARGRLTQVQNLARPSTAQPTVAPDGTVIAAPTAEPAASMSDSEVERILILAENAGIDGTETTNIRTELTKRAHERIQAAMAASMDDGSTVMNEIDNFETAVHSSFITAEEQQQGMAAVNQKLVQLVQAKTLPLHARANLLRHVSHGERDVDKDLLKGEAESLSAAVLAELQDAAAALDAGRLNEGIEAAGITADLASSLQVPADGLEVELASAAHTVEIVYGRENAMTDADERSHQHGLTRLMAAVEAARAAGCSPSQLAPYEQMVRERQAEVEAARAKIRAALFGELAGGGTGRRLAEGGAKTAEELEAELEPLRAVHNMILQYYPDIVADGDPFLDQLVEKIQALEEQINQLP